VSEEIQRVLIIAAAIALVVVIALVLRQRFTMKVGDRELGTGGRERAIDQKVAVKGLGSSLEDASQDAPADVAGSQTIDVRAGGKAGRVKQNIRDPGPRA
jgi:hypothetical protein